jgi:hypothetical protein
MSVRIDSRSDVECTLAEVLLVNKGLCYNLLANNINWIYALAIEADAAVSRQHSYNYKDR